jgi:hypothetical protein
VIYDCELEEEEVEEESMVKVKERDKNQLDVLKVGFAILMANK